MVKSRREASCRQSVVNATTAWRPSVSTSRRSVVTSKPRPATTAVTVPCASPVGTTFTPACCNAAITTSGASGVARSMSASPPPRPATVSPASASRTAPPTTRASGSASQTLPNAGSVRKSGRVMAARPDAPARRGHHAVRREHKAGPHPLHRGAIPRPEPSASVPRSRPDHTSARPAATGDGNHSRHAAKTKNGARNSTISIIRGIAGRSLPFRSDRCSSREAKPPAGGRSLAVIARANPTRAIPRAEATLQCKNCHGRVTSPPATTIPWRASIHGGAVSENRLDRPGQAVPPGRQPNTENRVQPGAVQP